MIEVENKIKSTPRIKSQNKGLKPIFVILTVVLILGATWSGVVIVSAQPDHDPVWDLGDVPQMIDFMAEHRDPDTNDWTFPEGSEDRAIADEMLRVMTEIQRIRDSFPYSCPEALDKLEEVYASIIAEYASITIVEVLDGVGIGTDLLIDEIFHEIVKETFGRVAGLDSFESAKLFIGLISNAADIIDNGLTTGDSIIRQLPVKSTTIFMQDAKLIQKVGDVLEWVLPLCDIAVILISHVLITQLVLSLPVDFPEILNHLIYYEVGGDFLDFESGSVEHIKLYFDLFEVGAEFVGSKLGAKIGLKLGMAFGTAITPGVGTVIGGAIGGVIGSWVGGELAERAVRTAYAWGTQKGYLPQPAFDKFERYYYEKKVQVEIVDIWSSGNDNYVPVGEFVHVRLRNGPLAGEFKVAPVYSDWTIFAAPDDPLEIAAFIINPLGTLTGILWDNTRTIYLDPYEEKEVWFLITPFGLVHEFPFLNKYSFDTINFAIYYQHAAFTEPLLKAFYGEDFTSAACGPAFNIDVLPSNLIYSPGETVSVDITVENIGTEEGTFTLGVSFRSLNPVKVYDGASITPSNEGTLAPGQILTFHAERTIPQDAPQGQYQIAVNCWEVAYTVLYPDNLEWRDIFTISSPVFGTYMSIVERSPAELDLYDPAGRHVGKDESFIGAYYTHDPGTDDRIIEVNDLIEGIYRIVLTGLEADTYDLEIDVTQSGNPIYQKTYTNTIDIDEIHELYVTISVDELGQISASSTAPEIPFEPLPPTADAGDDIITEEGKVTPFDGTKSSTPMGRIVKYEWDFNEDGVFDATGPYPTFVYYDNCIVTVTLQVTSEIETSSIGDDGQEVIKIITLTDTDTQTVTVLNLDPTASIDCGYMYVDFTLRFAGEKWHNVYWDLYETDEAEEEDGIGDGGQVGHGELIAHLECVRYPGDPDAQSDTVYDVYIDAEKIYYSITTYNPYEDDMPISGQPHGSNPTWIDMTFEDGSTERIHHNFNEIQSIVRDSDHWVHRHPWPLDFSPWLVTHTWTFEGSTTDQGTDDETFTWDWDDETPFDIAFYTYRRPDPTTDPFPSPYDRDEGAYPVDITDTQYHAYMMEDDFVPELTITDDDYPAEGEIENDGMALDSLDVDAIHTREIQLPDGTKLARK